MRDAKRRTLSAGDQDDAVAWKLQARELNNASAHTPGDDVSDGLTRVEVLYQAAKKRKTLTSVHASVLDQVHELGRYPCRITCGPENASAEQK